MDYGTRYKNTDTETEGNTKLAPERQYFIHTGDEARLSEQKIHSDTHLHRYYTKYCSILYNILYETIKGSLRDCKQMIGCHFPPNNCHTVPEAELFCCQLSFVLSYLQI